MNDLFADTRQVALDLLKPSKRDLEHGLKLHQESLVVESYGLGLQSPLDPDRLNAAIDAGATNLEIQDLVEDMIFTGWTATPELRQEYHDTWEAAGVTCTMQNAGEEGNEPMVLIKRLARHSRNTDAMPKTLHRAVTPDAIEEAHRLGKHCTYFTCNGIPITPQLNNVFEAMRMIPVFAELGVRMMHLTYNRRNLIGDGCGEPTDAGLSDFGHHVIAEMNRVGIMVDLAHTGWQTCVDAAKVSERPVVVSHSTVAALHEHLRSKPDYVIKAVLDSGGVMGITNVPAFLGGSGDIIAFLDHIDYMVKHFGIDSVCIGTDCGHASVKQEESMAKIRQRGPRRPRWSGLWPADRNPLTDERWKKPEQRQSMAWVNWPLFTVGLVQRGYSDDEIRQIIGGNIMRVARAAWEGTAYASVD